ncbi:MAG: D-aminoacyl-tRNA deacylase [Culicoidibacterales bacterium]
MRVVMQRVQGATVRVEQQIVGQIQSGFLLYIGFGKMDTVKTVEKVAEKILSLRLFADENGKMNEAFDVANQKMLAVSQFTLYADLKKGRRPSFTGALVPTEAQQLYEYFCTYCQNKEIVVEKGVFGADMLISSTNDGPVTILLDSETL